MIEYIEKIPDAFYPVFIGISAFVENVFPPYPGDTVIVIGGALASSAKLDLVSLYLAVLLGNLTSALLMFYVGGHVIAFLRRLLGKSKMADFLDPENLKKSEVWFKKYGFWAVVFSRFSAGIRFFVAIVAGMSKMNVAAFTIAFTLATLIWNTLLIYGGYALGANWNKVVEIVRLYNIVVMSLIAVLVAAYIAYRYYRNRNAEKNS